MTHWPCKNDECDQKAALEQGYCEDCEDCIALGEEILDGTFQLKIKPEEFK